MEAGAYPEFGKLQLSPKRRAFYEAVVGAVAETDLPFLIGGALAFGFYTDIWRDTKDLDIFLQPETIQPILDHLRERGFATELTFPHWLAKVKSDDALVDFIFRGSNGVCSIDSSWFEGVATVQIFGCSVNIVRSEDLIRMKAFVMERERFDGHDILHLLFRQVDYLDWDRLLDWFSDDKGLLLSLLAMFQYAYPFRAGSIPAGIRAALAETWLRPPQASEPLCNGTLLSKRQYETDISAWGLVDARTTGRCQITEQEIRRWSSYDAD
ncbi:MAG: nucleotidyltransferase [Verrucomicrobia bacterium]|nr:nucleotidyltransferase [Verrucomicrobiota bacterium]